jgi:hypothetical protein
MRRNSNSEEQGEVWQRKRQLFVDQQRYCGNVFVVKIGPQEYGLYGWAAYEDITPDFLGLLEAGPLKSWREDIGFRRPREASGNRS